MSSDAQGVSRSLPEKPELIALEKEARNLIGTGTVALLADAQLQIAGEYGFSNWTKLKEHVEFLQLVARLKDAIDGNDRQLIQAMMTRDPALHGAPLGYHRNGPLTWVAECRVPRVAPNQDRLAIAQWMIENGSDVHQGGDGPLMRAALDDMRIPMMELLVANGADVNALWNGEYPIIFALCETLQSQSLQWLIEHGADMHAAKPDGFNCVQMLIGTYWRNPAGKHACLEVFASKGYQFPNTAPMAIHRGRIDLLEDLLTVDPSLLHHRFLETEIYPPQFCGIGMHVAPLAGVTLLHMAIEYQETKIAQWLIDRGADVNARSEIDGDGFGGHTPLFHTTVTLSVKPNDSLVRLLLENGADPNRRATFRKQLHDMGDREKERLCENHDVTAITFARIFQEPQWINESAIAAIQEYGGN